MVVGLYKYNHFRDKSIVKCHGMYGRNNQTLCANLDLLLIK